MNLEQIEWRVRRLVGQETVERLTDPDLLRDKVNEAYRDLCGLEDWPFLNVNDTIATVNGQATYVLPTPLRWVDEVSIGSGDARGVLMHVEGRGVDADDELDAGHPIAYAMREPDELELVPTPDAVYTVTVRGRQGAPALAVDTDVPLFRSDYHPALVYMAAVYVVEEEPEFDPKLKQRWEELAGAYVERMASDYLRVHDHGSVTVGGQALGGRYYKRAR